MCHQIDNIIANGNKMQSPAPTQAGAAISAGDRHAHARTCEQQFQIRYCVCLRKFMLNHNGALYPQNELQGDRKIIANVEKRYKQNR